MPQPVFVSARAQSQQRAIISYLNSRNSAAAERLVGRFEEACRQSGGFPLSGARGPTPNTRRLVVSPYVVTYRVGSQGVVILDIRHGRQREPPAEDTFA